MQSLLNLRQWQFALKNLIAKDFRVRYRNMALGVVWSVINPLIMLAVITFVITFVFPSSRMPFWPVFVLTGLVAYNLMTRTVSTATVAVTQNAQLVKKVAFPRILIPLSAVISQLMDGAIMLLLLGLFILLFQVPITVNFLWLFPVYFTELIFIMGLSAATAALNVYFRDMRYLVESIFTIAFWLTPIFYPLSRIRDNVPGWLYNLYLLNPIAGCVNAARRAILENRPPELHAFGIAVAVSVVTLVVGLLMFETMQRKFADYT